MALNRPARFSVADAVLARIELARALAFMLFVRTFAVNAIAEVRLRLAIGPRRGVARAPVAILRFSEEMRVFKAQKSPFAAL